MILCRITLALGISAMKKFKFQLETLLKVTRMKKEDAEKLVDYFIYEFAPSRSERNHLEEFETALQIFMAYSKIMRQL